MRELKDFVTGPFKNERDFKQAVKAAIEKQGNTCLEIENEEKEPGMPDLLVINTHTEECFGVASFVEIKYASMAGTIRFEKSQPLFYRKHPELSIDILVWDNGRVVQLLVEEVLAARSLRMSLRPKGDK
jgi:hypothetical protein